MSAGTLTFKAGSQREPRENEFSGQDGTYSMILVSVTPPYEDDSQFSKTGKGEYRRWLFAVDDGGAHDGQQLDLRTSNSNSDKSKQFEVVAALIGRNPAIGAPIDIDKHLVGRSALVSIVSNDNGYPRIEKLMAAPRKAGARPDPKPAAPAPADDSDDDMPF